ncbi:MAG TPA: class I SAM-dependent methyltransferase, partial [Thermoanaerobaculia bacterium]|nr:class I SAM-dependent methyltransferase [Thermoanaerobaculia bacterium]
MTEATVRDAYERVPYPSGSIPSSHADNLAVRALLFGLEPPDLRRVRVLELGCADGGNLVPMASELPEGSFLGIDLSPRQIAMGQERLKALGIGNVELRAMSILDVDASLGEFDYVLVHGVFSWVTPEIQDVILRICREHLAPRGVAYVSYNAYPGWHQRQMMREMMLYHTRGIEDLYEQSERSLDLLGVLAEASAKGDEVHGRFLQARFEHLSGYRDRPSYLIHEYLEESNNPLYFHRFMEMAGRHGLQYIADAENDLGEIDLLPPAVAERLRSLARDRIELEQHLDFVLNRTFRRSLLCREGIPLEELAMVPERMRRFHAASPVRPDAESPDVRSHACVTFRSEKDRTFTVSHPPTKALLVALAETWPRPLAFAGLLARAGDLLGAEVEEGLAADILFSLYGGGFLDLHMVPPRCTERVSERPEASPLARREATLGPFVTNQRRRVLKLDDDLARTVLLHLDGTRDRAALREVLAEEVREGRLGIAKDGEPVQDPAQLAT